MTSTRVLDSLVIAGLILFPIFAPGYLDLGTRVVILVLAAMSLDLPSRYCGSSRWDMRRSWRGALRRRHSCLRASAEPVLGLLAGGAAGAVLGVVSVAVPAAERR